MAVSTQQTKSRQFGRIIQNLPTKQAALSEAKRIALMFAGITIGAFSFALFQEPHQISWGGTGGISQILHFYTGVSYSYLYWSLALPMLILGFFHLGRWNFLYKSIAVTFLYGIAIDLAVFKLPLLVGQWPISDNMLLNTIYGGVLGGISGGLIYRSGTAFPGTSVISRIVNARTGLPLSSSYLMVDGGIIVATGVVFGIENAMYGMVMLFVGGIVTDYALEGPSTTRTVSIVTNHPEAIANMMLAKFNKGASFWQVTGGYTGQQHYMVNSTIFRSQMGRIKAEVQAVDSDAFVTIGISHKAMGVGFTPLK